MKNALLDPLLNYDSLSGKKSISAPLLHPVGFSLLYLQHPENTELDTLVQGDKYVFE